MRPAPAIDADERVAELATRGRVLRAVAWALALSPKAWASSGTARVAYRLAGDVRGLVAWQRVRVAGGALLVALATHAVIAVAAGRASAPVVAAWLAVAAVGAALAACPRGPANAWRTRSQWPSRRRTS